jgi:type I restriction enzyme S subunit
MELSKSAALSLSKGYKQSEIGNIPDEWDVKQLKDITTFRRGSFPQPYGLTKWYDDFNGAPFVQVFDVDNNGQIKNETKRKISKEAQFYSVFAPKGTLILTIQGSIGRMAITQYDAYIDRTLLIFEGYKIPLDIVYFATSIQVLFEREEKIAPGGIIKTITKEALSTFCIPLPPTKAEQTAIANALSDADALISSLEKLINKKRNIKQGAMQQLLKPKKGWVVKKLGEICEIEKGEQLNRATLSENDTYPVLNGGVAPSGYTNVFNQNENTIIISEGGNSCGFVNYIKTKFWQGGHCYSLKTKLSHDFVFQVLKFYEKTIMALRVGSGLPNIQRSRLITFEISIPKAEAEQKEIATILSDMDNEITSLEKKLSKSKMLKQGMMQELLTGKIRLV